ncbi:hypothetical protein DMUE_4795 [Dictyocoela muelleri]|nr:hypothetical protein DMUE_4795 [Dictyocoela muelleri]
MPLWKIKKWIYVLRSLVYQYNTSVHRETSKTLFEVFRGILIGENSRYCIKRSGDEVLKNLNNYISKIYKKNESTAMLNFNDRVLLAKNFYNNINSKKMHWIVIFIKNILCL